MKISYLVPLLWVVLASWGYIECSKFRDSGDMPAVRRVKKDRPEKLIYNTKGNGIEPLSKSTLGRRKYKYSHSVLPHISRPEENEIQRDDSVGSANKIKLHQKKITKVHQIPNIEEQNGVNEIQSKSPIGRPHKIIQHKKVTIRHHKIPKIKKPVSVHDEEIDNKRARNTKAEAARRRYEQFKDVVEVQKPQSLMRTILTHNIPQNIIYKLYNDEIKGYHFKGYLTKDPQRQHLERHYNRIHYTTARPYKHVTARSVRYKNVFADIMSISRGEDTSSMQYKKNKIKTILDFIVKPLPLENGQYQDPAFHSTPSNVPGTSTNTDVVASKDIVMFPDDMKTQEMVGARLNGTQSASQVSNQTQVHTDSQSQGNVRTGSNRNMSDRGTRTTTVDPTISQHEINHMKTYIDMVKKIQTQQQNSNSNVNIPIREQGQSNRNDHKHGTDNVNQQYGRRSQDIQRNPGRQSQKENPSKGSSPYTSEPQSQSIKTGQQEHQQSRTYQGNQGKQPTAPNYQTNRQNQGSASKRVRAYPPRSGNQSGPTQKQELTRGYKQGTSITTRQRSQQQSIKGPSNQPRQQQPNTPKTGTNMPVAKTPRTASNRQGYQENTRTPTNQRRPNNQIVPIKTLTSPNQRVTNGRVPSQAKQATTTYGQGGSKTGQPNTTPTSQKTGTTYAPGYSQPRKKPPTTGPTRRPSTKQGTTYNPRSQSRTTTRQPSGSSGRQRPSSPQQTPKQRAKTYPRNNQGSSTTGQPYTQQRMIPAVQRPIEYPMKESNKRPAAQNPNRQSIRQTQSGTRQPRTQMNSPNVQNAKWQMKVNPNVHGRTVVSGTHQSKPGGQQIMHQFSQQPNVLLSSA